MKKVTLADMLNEFLCEHELKKMIEARDRALNNDLSKQEVISGFADIMADCEICKKHIKGEE